jgi:hypothetical protein
MILLHATAPPDVVDLKPPATEKVTTTTSNAPLDWNELKSTSSDNEAEKLPKSSVTSTATSLPDSNELKSTLPDNEAEKLPEKSAITTATSPPALVQLGHARDPRKVYNHIKEDWYGVTEKACQIYISLFPECLPVTRMTTKAKMSPLNMILSDTIG